MSAILKMTDSYNWKNEAPFPSLFLLLLRFTIIKRLFLLLFFLSHFLSLHPIVHCSSVKTDSSSMLQDFLAGSSKKHSAQIFDRLKLQWREAVVWNLIRLHTLISTCAVNAKPHLGLAADDHIALHLSLRILYVSISFRVPQYCVSRCVCLSREANFSNHWTLLCAFKETA